MVNWNNKVEVREYHRDYREKHSIKIKKYQRTYSKKYRENHKEEMRENHDKWYENNRKKVLIYFREYREKNNKKLRKYSKKWQSNKYKNDVQYKLRSKMSCRFNQAKSRYSKYGVFAKSRDGVINYRAVIENLIPFPNDLEGWDVDHIIPLSFFDLTDLEQVRKAWSPINHQWLKSNENESKGFKIDFIKYPKQKEVWKILGLENKKLKLNKQMEKNGK